MIDMIGIFGIFSPQRLRHNHEISGHHVTELADRSNVPRIPAQVQDPRLESASSRTDAGPPTQVVRQWSRFFVTQTSSTRPTSECAT
jgi:hypothetical protein